MGSHGKIAHCVRELLRQIGFKISLDLLFFFFFSRVITRSHWIYLPADYMFIFKRSQNNNFTSEAWLCFRKSGLVRLFFISVRLAWIPDKCSRILGAQRLLAQELSEL